MRRFGVIIAPSAFFSPFLLLLSSGEGRWRGAVVVAMATAAYESPLLLQQGRGWGQVRCGAGGGGQVDQSRAT